MTVREKLQSAAWVRAMHTPEQCTNTIHELEKMLTYHVQAAMDRHQSARLRAEELTAEEFGSLHKVLRRIMEEALELAAQLEVVGMETMAEKLAQTYESKNHYYGNSFGETQELYGMVAGAVRIHDKVARVFHLASGSGQRVIDERIGDTVQDLATYAAMVLSWMEAGLTGPSSENGCREEEAGDGC